MKRKLLIFAPPYDPDMGGAVVMHKLCSLLNELGEQAYVYRLFNNQAGLLALTRLLFKSSVRGLISSFNVNRRLQTPVLPRYPRAFDDEWIVVYPEIVRGNPLQAKNVVRWMLYRPGFHTGDMLFGENEFHVDYNRFLDEVSFPGCYKARNSLYVVHFPFEIYNQVGALPPTQRRGTAYCVRKGAGKPMQHDLTDSVLIDGKSAEAVAATFRTVTRFISYDPYTAYSSFAVLCGAESVVVPDAGVSKEAWHPDPAERYGVAYGWDDRDWARQTAGLLLEHMMQKERRSIDSVRDFLAEVGEYFDVLRSQGK